MGVQLVQYNFAKHGSTTNIKLNPNSTSKRKIITKKMYHNCHDPTPNSGFRTIIGMLIPSLNFFFRGNTKSKPDINNNQINP